MPLFGMGGAVDEVDQSEQILSAPGDATISARVKAMKILQAKHLKNQVGRDGINYGVTDQVSVIPAGRVERGPADNVQVFGMLNGSGTGAAPLILRNLDLSPFSKESVDKCTVGFDGLLLATCVCTLRFRQQDRRRQQLIAEMLVPYYPENQIKSKAESLAIMEGLLGDVAAIRDEAWWADAVAALRRADNKAITCWKDGEWVTGTEFKDRWAAFVAIGSALGERAKNRANIATLLLVISFAMRGEISDQKLTKLKEELNLLIPGVTESLTRQEIAATWRNFGHLVNDATVPKILARWMSYLAAPAIRLRVLLAQAAGSGLTSLDVIARAIHEHNDFPWYALKNLYPDQWTAAMEAIVAIGDNPYYGYRGDLSRVRSTKYKHLSWACGFLLIELGDTSLKNYKGFVVDKPNEDAVVSLIHGYIKTLGGAELIRAPTAEDCRGLKGVFELVRTHPANTGSLLNMEGHSVVDADVDDRDGDQSGGAGGTSSPLASSASGGPIFLSISSGRTHLSAREMPSDEGAEEDEQA